jgi:hypothetical protein
MLAIATGLVRASPASACAAAFPEDEKVLMAREEAVMVWDESAHLEHFVRKAVFRSTARSFGFLVPTPGRPSLGEVDEKAFSALHERTRNQAVGQMALELQPRQSLLSYLLFRKEHAPGASAPVGVLEETRVAGLDASVLLASDADALADWLHARGFEERKAIQRWLRVYVAKGWYVTAFRFERPGKDLDPVRTNRGDVSVDGGHLPDPIALTSKAVRISFPASEPVYPYLEPDDVSDVPLRTLDLFVLASRRLDGALLDEGSRPWDAQVDFAAGIEPSPWLGSELGVDLAGHLWLTRYVDHASKREASDVVFRPSASAGEIHPPVWVYRVPTSVPVPYELLPVGAGLWWWRRRVRKRGEDVVVQRSPGA